MKKLVFLLTSLTLALSSAPAHAQTQFSKEQR